jgi:hypothetical protein
MLDPWAGGIRATYQGIMRHVCMFNALPLLPNLRFSATLSSDELERVDHLLVDYLNQTPTQGLAERSGRMREIGRRYRALAVGSYAPD